MSAVNYTALLSGWPFQAACCLGTPRHSGGGAIGSFNANLCVMMWALANSGTLGMMLGCEAPPIDKARPTKPSCMRSLQSWLAV